MDLTDRVTTFTLPVLAGARGISRITLYLSTAFILILASVLQVHAANVQVSLDRDTIALGETATLTLTVEGASIQGAHPNVPTPAGLRIAPDRQSTQISIIQGEQTMQATLTYMIEPTKVGDFVIPPITVPTDAGALRSRPISLKVTAAANVNPGEGPAYLQIVPKKTQAYFGEALPVDIQLYAEQGQLREGPQLSGDGFNFGKILDQPTQSRVRINNRNMTLVVFRALAVPIKTGQLQIGPLSLAMSVPVPGSRMDFFGFRQSQNIRVTAAPVTVTVLPLPPGAPPEFTGAVGRFQLEYSAAPTTVTVGDPITLKIQINGVGIMDRVALPSLDHWKSFKFYPPNSKTDLADPLEMSGTKSFEQVVVPQSPEITGLPEFRWSYFDPDEKAYKVLKGAAVPLHLTSAATGNAPTPALPNSGKKNTEDSLPKLAHIRPQLGTVVQVPSPLWQKSWFLALQGLPIALWGFLRVQRWRVETLSKNPRQLRRRALELKVTEGLKTLRAEGAANRTEAFFTTLTQVIRCQIAERFDLQENALTESVIEEKLKPAGLSAEDSAQLEELFRQANQFRYAAQSTPGQLMDLVPRVERAVESLRRLPGAS